MIDRLLENWLNKASERSYQLPFCYLLLNRGENVIHLTRHCGMEHGKDIITIDQGGIYRSYQLKGVKGGKLSLKEWQGGVQQQVYSLVHTPIIHPSVDIGKGHLSYLVINGGIEEEVQAAIAAINNKCEINGKPEEKINLILKGDVLEMLRDLKQDFLPSEVPDFQNLLTFYQQDGQSFLNKSDFWALLNSILLPEKQGLSQFKRSVSSCSILCSLALSSYTLVENHFAIVEGWTLFISTILRYTELQSMKYSDIKKEIELADKIILTTLSNLWEEIKDVSLLIDKTGPDDVYIYPYRLTMILGMLAYLASRKEEEADVFIDDLEIYSFIVRHVGQIKIWGESALPFLLSVYWLLEKKDNDLASELLSLMLLKWVTLDGLPENLFANVYLSAEDALTLENDWTIPASDLQEHISIESTLETVVHLCAKKSLKKILIETWPNISAQIYRDLEFEEIQDFYLWISRYGKETSRFERTGHNWFELVQEATHIQEDLIPILLRKNEFFIPLFLMVYPHRVRKNITIWYDSKISNEPETT